MAQDLANYDLVCQGKAGGNKLRYIAAISQVTDEIYNPQHKDWLNELNPNFANVYFTDGLNAARDIIKSGEKAAFFTSAITPWFVSGIKQANPELHELMFEKADPKFSLQQGDKTRASAFHDLKARMNDNGIYVATYTDDEPLPIRAAKESGVCEAGMVFVDRKGKFEEDSIQFSSWGVPTLRDLSNPPHLTLTAHLD